VFVANTWKRRALHAKNAYMARSDSQTGSLPALQLQPIVLALPQLGIDPAPVFARYGVGLASLSDPRLRLPAQVELDLWSALVAETGDPLIGLKLADVIPDGGFWTYEYLLRHSSTIGAALEKAVRYQRIFANDVQLRLVEGDRNTIARLDHEGMGAYPHPPQATECLFAVIFRVINTLVPSARAKEVHFTHERLGPMREYLKRFGCRMRFSQPYNEVVFATDELEREVVSADQCLAHVLEEHVQRVLASVPNLDPWLPRARSALDSLLEARAASLQSLAKALHVSARTLRRRLNERGSSYRGLLDDARRSLALQCVPDAELSFDEIAAALGFHDLSAFYRAFRRWTNATPAAYRARRLRNTRAV
jgi:AraC-like DNA-binding protein